jgi:two-component system sensor histidine kinase BarA
MLKVSITDNGIGIKEEEHDKIFNEFGRINMIDTVQGTGLGLVLSRKLIENLHGDIGFTSSSGEGSTFWFSVPVKKSED